MNQLVIISGPTASGKSSLAQEIAKKYNGELISADSRQIYKGMDIGTGKDLDNTSVFNFQFSVDKKDVGYYLVDGIPLWLMDIIHPNQSFSVAEYRQLALRVIADIQSRGKLPIIVGGTGQYIDSLINPKPTFDIKPNPILRLILNRLSLSALQFTLRHIDFQTFRTLNNSDIHNTRRLIRKIEIRLNPSGQRGMAAGRGDFDFLHISLTAPNEFLYARVDKRVDDRLKSGLINEIRGLLTKYSWHHPGLNTLAYKEFIPHFQGSADLDACISKWKFDEHAYVRRQKTWFKKIPNIHFIDITQLDYSQTADNLIQSFLTN